MIRKSYQIINKLMILFFIYIDFIGILYGIPTVLVSFVELFSSIFVIVIGSEFSTASILWSCNAFVTFVCTVAK